MTTDTPSLKDNPLGRGVRVGIVGHRPKHPLRAEIPAEIANAFALIEKAAGDVRVITLVSGLAEGVDQMAVASKPAGWRLEGILPFRSGTYENDFVKSADGSGRDVRREFLEALAVCDRVAEIDSERDDAQSYYRSGLFMLGTLDVVVAVWNGLPPAGAGGTGDVVRAAAEARIPVLWIASGQADPLRLITDDPLGWHFEAIADRPKIEAYFADFLQSGEPVSKRQHKHEKEGVSEAKKAESFLEERSPVGRGPQIYAWVRRLTSSSGGHRPTAGEHAKSHNRNAALPAAPQLQSDLDREVRQLHERSDELAIYYANTYRSAYILTYACAFLAVVLALGGLNIPHDYSVRLQVDLKALLVAMELGIVAIIVGIVIAGTRHRWHEKWMDYRAVAEMSRHVLFLAYLGGHRRFGALTRGGARQGSWTHLMVDRAASCVGLPDAIIDKAYLSALAGVVRDREVEDQRVYHTDNARKLYAMNHLLHQAGNWCFYLTAILLAAFLVLYGAELVLPSHGPLLDQSIEHEAPQGLLGFLYSIKAAVGFFAAALPALGAALSGIRFTGEFETLAGRSEAMAIGLYGLRRSYGKLVKAPDFDQSVEIVMETATILSADIKEWKTLYAYKRLNLPA